MAKKKYSKCQCCPYYVKDFADNKWKCARNDKNKSVYASFFKPYCIFRFSDNEQEKKEIIERWINANKE